ncbi:hypothetical protein AAVH_16076 [Aphelenchoides avenae]|nr:hypothetical protein AAVH_16076 [Aphelenchus avenae]
MKSLLAILAIVGGATSASINQKAVYGKDAASWCNPLPSSFGVDLVTLGRAEWLPENLPGSFDRSLPSIAKIEKEALDRLMLAIGATKSWTTGMYTVDCANAASFPTLKVFTDFDELSFTPSDYLDLKNAKVGRCEVLLRPDSSAGHWTFGNLAWKKYCGASSERLIVVNH